MESGSKLIATQFHLSDNFSLRIKLLCRNELLMVLTLRDLTNSCDYLKKEKKVNKIFCLIHFLYSKCLPIY